MKRELLAKLQYGNASPNDWELQVTEENETEIRQGTLYCKASGVKFPIEDGILNMLGELPEEVAREKAHSESHEYVVTNGDEKHPINRATISRFRKLFLALPAGDGSAMFKPGGSFDNQAGNAERFFKALDMLNLSGRESILEVGAGFGWGARYLAERGCEVVALDVTNYLMVGDLYFEEDGCYFDRVMSDMNRLPFCDHSFDLVFSNSVMHHCKDLAGLFGEFYRVLKPGGRLVALHECTFGIFESKAGHALKEAIHEGYNENAYTIPEWRQGAKRGGFRRIRFHFFSFVDDYIARKKLRGSPRTAKLRLAYWLKSHPNLHRLINQLSILPRIFLRPKSWMIIATK